MKAMKTIHSLNERLKLYAYGCFMIFIALPFLVKYGNYNVNLLSVYKFDISLTLPNSTHPNDFQALKPTNPIECGNKQNISTSSHDHHEEEEKCNLFKGEWIYDPEGSPLYDAAQCPFLSEQVSCRANGREDFEYEKWRWEPKGCDIPRNDIGKQMLERLRGKRAIIVGDSLNRNQFESLACLLYTALPPSQSHVRVNSGGYKVFKAKEYNCSVEFYWSPFLVQFDVKETNGEKVLRLDQISASAKWWKGADMMVFNTGHWWSHIGNNQPRDYNFNYKGKLEKNMETESALALAMETWSRWISENVDASKTRVFFRSVSPEHKGNDWCYNQTQPVVDDSYTTRYPPRMRQVVEGKIQEMASLVTYLNITKLSQHRKDGHPSIYRTKEGPKFIATQKKRPENFADCSHWCLPGVPDTWNMLFLASMPLETSRSISIT